MQYNFRVKATNGRGDSAWSNTITEFSGTAPQQPTNVLTALNTDYTSVDIRWNQPATCGFGVSGCKVRIQWFESINDGNNGFRQEARYEDVTRYCGQVAT